MAETKNPKNETATEEAAPAVDIRVVIATKIQEQMETIAPILVDLLHGDYFLSRTPEVITAERIVMTKFVELVKLTTQGANGYDKQLERVRNLKGSDFAKSVQPFRAPKVAVKSKTVDSNKLLSDLF